ncbi:VOC family protein [Sphingomonas panacis]|uniref:VOC family protein n=1 Tax=Sphingomonas panacis TaxID=1560345 RepID=UPI0009F295D2|nr:VOC family protein [Sphingomonas panacis]
MCSARAVQLIGCFLTVASPASLTASTEPHNVAARSAALDHIAIYVADLDRSVIFYREVFGFREVPAPFPIARWLVTGNGLMLHLVKGRSLPVDNTKWDHIAIAWGPMEETIATLDAKKIAWSDIQGRHVPQIRPDGVKQIFVRDPDGYWIEINDSLKNR